MGPEVDKLLRILGAGSEVGFRIAWFQELTKGSQLHGQKRRGRD